MTLRIGLSAILFCCLLVLTGCNSNSDLEKSARASKEAGHQCLLDVMHMQFLESQNCVNYPEIFAAAVNAQDDFRSSWQHTWFGDQPDSVTADVANGMANYLLAVAYNESGNPEHIRGLFNAEYVKKMHQQSGKTFKKRPPAPPRY